MCFYLLWIISAERYWKKCNSHFLLRRRLQWCAELSIICVSSHDWASPGVSAVKNLPAMQEVQETWVWYLCWEDPLEEGLATHSSILAWRIPFTQEPSGLQSIGSQRVGHRWSNWAHTNAPVMIILGFIWEEVSYSCRKTWTVRRPLFIAWKTLSMQKWEVKLKPEPSLQPRLPLLDPEAKGRADNGFPHHRGRLSCQSLEWIRFSGLHGPSQPFLPRCVQRSGSMKGTSQGIAAESLLSSSWWEGGLRSQQSWAHEHWALMTHAGC